MKNAILSLAAIIAVAGCQQPAAQNNAGSKPSAAAPSKQPLGPAVFEIRDFKLDEDKGEYSTTVKGRGTLVTRDPRLASGNFMVWVAAKQAHENDEPWQTQILLKDGLGTIETFYFLSKSDKNNVRYYEWEILGFIPLEMAEMKTVSESKPVVES